MAFDPLSVSIAVLALAAVFLLWFIGYREQQLRTNQLRILAQHAKALEEMVKSQGKVVSGLGQTQRGVAPDWFAEAERRRQKAESDPALEVWDDLQDLVGR